MAKHPKISAIITKSLGKIDVAIEYLRVSDAKEARELVRIWDGTSRRDRTILPFEAYCLAAGTTPKRMMGIIMEAVTEESNIASTLLAASAHPEIVQKTIKIAKTNRGEAERKILHQNRGFLPTPKNNVINNWGSINQDNRKQIANIAVTQLEADGDEISGVVDQFNSQRVMPAARPEVIDILNEE